MTGRTFFSFYAIDFEYFKKVGKVFDEKKTVPIEIDMCGAQCFEPQVLSTFHSIFHAAHMRISIDCQNLCCDCVRVNIKQADL